MKKWIVFSIIFFVGFVRLTTSPRAKKMQREFDFGALPLYFIPNEGQVDPDARFYARATKCTLWVTPGGLVFDNTTPEANKPKSRLSRLLFPGANNSPEIFLFNVTPLKSGRFLYDESAGWTTGSSTSRGVLYKGLYNRVDLKVYGSMKQLEYHWLVLPGGKPENIRFHYKNVKNTTIDKDGNLVVETAFGKLIHKKPAAVCRETDNGVSTTGSSTDFVDVSFKNISGDTYGFEVGDYDRSRSLIIDPPVLINPTF